MENGEKSPADILIFCTNEYCQVESFDSSGSIKITNRQPITRNFNLDYSFDSGLTELLYFNGMIECESPNGNVNLFEGNLMKDHDIIAEKISVENIIMREETFMAGDYLLGIVINVGKETKISQSMQNRYFRTKKKHLDFTRYLLILIIFIAFVTLITNINDQINGECYISVEILLLLGSILHPILSFLDKVSLIFQKYQTEKKNKELDPLFQIHDESTLPKIMDADISMVEIPGVLTNPSEYNLTSIITTFSIINFDPDSILEMPLNKGSEDRRLSRIYEKQSHENEIRESYYNISPLLPDNKQITEVDEEEEIKIDNMNESEEFDLKISGSNIKKMDSITLKKNNDLSPEISKTNINRSLTPYGNPNSNTPQMMKSEIIRINTTDDISGSKFALRIPYDSKRESDSSLKFSQENDNISEVFKGLNEENMKKMNFSIISFLKHFHYFNNENFFKPKKNGIHNCILFYSEMNSYLTNSSNDNKLSEFERKILIETMKIVFLMKNKKGIDVFTQELDKFGEKAFISSMVLVEKNSKECNNQVKISIDNVGEWPYLISGVNSFHQSRKTNFIIFYDYKDDCYFLVSKGLYPDMIDKISISNRNKEDLESLQEQINKKGQYSLVYASKIISKNEFLDYKNYFDDLENYGEEKLRYTFDYMNSIERNLTFVCSLQFSHKYEENANQLLRSLENRSVLTILTTNNSEQDGFKMISKLDFISEKDNLIFIRGKNSEEVASSLDKALSFMNSKKAPTNIEKVTGTLGLISGVHSIRRKETEIKSMRSQRIDKEEISFAMICEGSVIENAYKAEEIKNKLVYLAANSSKALFYKMNAKMKSHLSEILKKNFVLNPSILSIGSNYSDSEISFADVTVFVGKAGDTFHNKKLSVKKFDKPSIVNRISNATQKKERRKSSSVYSKSSLFKSKDASNERFESFRMSKKKNDEMRVPYDCSISVSKLEGLHKLIKYDIKSLYTKWLRGNFLAYEILIKVLIPQLIYKLYCNFKNLRLWDHYSTFYMINILLPTITILYLLLSTIGKTKKAHDDLVHIHIDTLKFRAKEFILFAVYTFIPGVLYSIGFSSVIIISSRDMVVERVLGSLDYIGFQCVIMLIFHFCVRLTNMIHQQVKSFNRLGFSILIYFFNEFIWISIFFLIFFFYYGCLIVFMLFFHENPKKSVNFLIIAISNHRLWFLYFFVEISFHLVIELLYFKIISRIFEKTSIHNNLQESFLIGRRRRTKGLDSGLSSFLPSSTKMKRVTSKIVPIKLAVSQSASNIDSAVEDQIKPTIVNRRNSNIEFAEKKLSFSSLDQMISKRRKNLKFSQKFKKFILSKETLDFKGNPADVYLQKHQKFVISLIAIATPIQLALFTVYSIDLNNNYTKSIFSFAFLCLTIIFSLLMIYMRKILFISISIELLVIYVINSFFLNEETDFIFFGLFSIQFILSMNLQFWKQFLFFMGFFISFLFKYNAYESKLGNQNGTLKILFFLTLSIYIIYMFWDRYKFEDYMADKVEREIKLRKEIDDNRMKLKLLLPDFALEKVIKNESFFIYQEDVIIIFIEINNFIEITDRIGKNIVGRTNLFYREIDQLCEKYGIQKIETVERIYMGAVGLSNHENNIHYKIKEINKMKRSIKFSFEVKNHAIRQKWVENINLSIKIGIHAGKVIAGVIGYHKPQFSLIGHTVNYASRVCSTCYEGSITLSENAYELIKDKEFEFSRELVKEAKGFPHGISTYEVYESETEKSQREEKLLIMQNAEAEFNPERMTPSVSIMQSKRINQSYFFRFNTHNTRRKSSLSKFVSLTPESTIKIQNSVQASTLSLKGITARNTRLLKSMALENSESESLNLIKSKVVLKRRNSIFTLGSEERIMEKLEFSVFKRKLEENRQYKEFLKQYFEDSKKIDMMNLLILIVQIFIYFVFYMSMISNSSGIFPFIIIGLLGLTLLMNGIMILFRNTFFSRDNAKFIYFLFYFLYLISAIIHSIEEKNNETMIEYSILFIAYSLSVISKIRILMFFEFLFLSFNILTIFTIIQITNLNLYFFINIYVQILAILILNILKNFIRFKISLILYNEKASNLEKSERLKNLLQYMIPSHIVMKNFERIQTELEIFEMKDVTILFADIAGFTKFSRKNQRNPELVIKTLELLYTNFDIACFKSNLYKVYTIGDCYVALGGISKDNRNCSDEIRRVIEFAFSIQDICKELTHKKLIPIEMRIGIHTGNVIGGIIGTRQIRYDIFGSEAHFANVMESNCENGSVLISHSTYSLVDPALNSDLEFQSKGKIASKKIDKQEEAYVVIKKENYCPRATNIRNEN